MKTQLRKKFKKEEKLFFSRKSSFQRIFVVLIFCFEAIQIGYAQNLKQVSGVVSDENGDPIIGATISVSGLLFGTATDLTGKFKLEVPANSEELTISYIGYLTQKVSIKNSNEIVVTLKEDLQQLNEVVVVGYGTTKKATLAGSVVAINNEQLTITKSTNVQNMLTGKLPGVRVIQKTSEPGQFTNQFDIRGFGNPLLVVDGVPRGDLQRMDPNDIESISVLKDASAAIYGVRAANGVVLVTTKSGEKGKNQIEYSMYYGIQTPAEILNPINAHDRAVLFNEITMRSTSNPVRTYDDAYFEQLARGEMPDTDWYGLVMNQTAPQQQHNVSIRGGSDRTDYYINFGYTDQGSFFKTNSANYNRYNLRSNLNVQVTKGLKASLKLNMIMDETNRQNVATSEIFKTLWRSRPNDPLYANDTEPYYYHPDDIQNVVALIYPELGGYVKNKKNIFQSNMNLVYDIPFIQGLQAKAMFSYDKTYNDDSNYKQEYDEYRYIATNDSYQTYRQNSKTNLRRVFSTSYTTLWQTSLNYDRQFNNHHVGALLLYEESYNQGYDFNAQREFDIPIPYLFAGNTTNQQGNGSGLTENANKAVVGRLNYDFKGKYILEGSFRYDGSSKFSQGHQWGFFPGAFAAWRISEEAFIKDNDKLSFIQNLKLRGSYGELGDDTAGQYQFIEGFDYPQSDNSRTTISRGYVFGNSYTTALGFRNAPNPYISWYTATMKNVGIDVDVWNGLFGFSVDIFQRDRDGLLATPTVIVPGTFGAGISEANLNADRTKGFEIELRHRNKINDFSYNVSGFVSMTRTLLTKKVQPERSNSYDYWKNNQLNRYTDIWFGKGANGQYTSYQEIANSIYANATTLPGDPIYVDWNGDGVIDAQDDHPIATTTNPNEDVNGQRNYPLMNFSLNLGGEYKGFDLNLLFQGSAMAYVSYGEQLLEPLAWNGNALELLYDRYHPVDINKDPYDPSNEWVTGYYPYGKTRAESKSEFCIQNGAYLRLKSADIGYTIPVRKTWLKHIGIQRLRLFFNAYNLLTFTKVKGVDPEKPSETGGYIYPLNRTFNFGGSISF
ncbi:MAG: TonB-dependent receptor [Tannerella sp.]|jgi:TonB-linked SusC/RagA family outer membrane protein|nr:TonB-dependent receptor [Tannerella sp.]